MNFQRFENYTHNQSYFIKYKNTLQKIIVKFFIAIFFSLTLRSSFFRVKKTYIVL